MIITDNLSDKHVASAPVHWLACFKAIMFLRFRAAAQALVVVRPRQQESNKMQLSSRCTVRHAHAGTLN